MRPVGDRRVVADQAARAAQQVALEVVGLGRVAVGVEPRVGGDAGGIEVPVDAGAQVERFARWRSAFAVLDLVDQDVAVQRARVGISRRGAAHVLLDRAAQRVVGGGEVVAAAVPGADGLAGHVVQHPARAGFHAELVDAVAEHVVGVAHDDALLERADRQAVDRQLRSSRTARWLPSMSSSTRVAKLSSVPSRSWPAQTTRLRATVRKGRPSASKCAVVGVSACAAARCGGRSVRRGPSGAADALRVPGLPGRAAAS